MWEAVFVRIWAGPAKLDEVKKRPTFPGGRRIKKGVEMGKDGRNCRNTIGKRMGLGGQAGTRAVGVSSRALYRVPGCPVFFTRDVSSDPDRSPAGKVRAHRLREGERVAEPEF